MECQISVLMLKWEGQGNISTVIYTPKMIKKECVEEPHLHSFWIPSIHTLVQLLLLNFLGLMGLIIGQGFQSYILHDVQNFILLMAREGEEIQPAVMILQLM